MASGTVYVGDVGDQIRFTGTFEADGVDTNPGEVLLRVKNPDGSVGTVATAAGTVTGTYVGTLTAGTAGVHWARLEGTDPVQAATEQRFEVRRSQF